MFFSFERKLSHLNSVEQRWRFFEMSRRSSRCVLRCCGRFVVYKHLVPLAVWKTNLMKQYYIIRNDQPAGPYTIEELATMGITPDTIVWAEDIVDWIPAYQVSELNSLFASTTAQTSPIYLEPSDRATEAPRYDTAGLEGRPSVRPPKPPTYLVWSILVTIFISRIIGIIALVYSVQVSSCYYAGNYEGAAHASRQARRWVRVPVYIVLGLLLAFLIEELIRWIVGA